MDQLNHYRCIIKTALSERANLMRSQPLPGEEVICILDDTTNNYLVLRLGWMKSERLYSITLHLRLVNGHIYVEQDWTDDFLIDLVEAGVPRKDIVLSFDPPEVRPQTEFAVA
jgi:hypothetical protein